MEKASRQTKKEYGPKNESNDAEKGKRIREINHMSRERKGGGSG